MSTLNEDPIEIIIGSFGKYQTWILVLLTLGAFPTDYQLNNVVFVIPAVDYTCLDANANNATNICPCENPQYDETAIVNSVTSEWNLICGRGVLASLAQSIMQLGSLIGTLVYSYVSDRYGRKYAALIPMALKVIFIVGTAVAPTFWLFLIFRFLIGTSIGGVMLCSFVLFIELTGKSFRPYVMGLEEVSFILGYFTLPIIAYFVREWRYLQLVTSVPWVLTWSYFWLIPESPRWLISAGKKQEAIQLLTHIAKKNNRPTDNIEVIIEKLCEESITDKQKKASVLELFKTPIIRLYTIATAFIWMFCSITYYGISQFMGMLEGNLYLNIIIAAACHVPGILVVVVTAKYFRRKITVVCCLIVAAISLLVFIFVPYSLRSLYLAFAVIGQIGAYAAFVMMYLYSSEVFPTVLRNTALGFASVFAKGGAFVAPFIVNIGTEWVSIFVFILLAILAAILCFVLPETKDIVLPDTVDQTEQLNSMESELNK